MQRQLADKRASDTGGVFAGLVVVIVVLAAAGVAAFFWLGGEADVDITPPDTTVTTAPAD